MHFIQIKSFFHKKKKNKCYQKVFKLQRYDKFCPMLVETPYSGGVINPKKNYINYEIGPKLLFLGSLAYKLVNLLVFCKILCKMSKN